MSLRNQWHLQKYPNNLLKAGFIEWKYFNFASRSLAGIIVYEVADPLNFTGLGGGHVIVRIFKNGKIYGQVKKIPIPDITASKTDAAVQMGKTSSIKVSGNNYLITGSSGSISWHLRYSSRTEAVGAFFDRRLDFLGIEKASWEIKMPKAKVEGLLKIGGKTLRINTFGYSDANWGELSPLATRFNWFQFNDKKISVVAGEMQNLEIGKKKIGRWAKAYAILGRKKIIFPQNRISVEETDWTLIPKTKIKTPRLRILRAENSSYRLVFKAKMLYADPIRSNMPFSIPIRPLIEEQFANYTGQLFKKVRGEQKLIYKFSGHGFMEYAFRNLEFRKKIKAGVLV